MGILDRAAALFNFSPGTGFEESLALSSPWAVSTTGLAAVYGMEGLTGEAVSVKQALSVPPVTRAVGQYSAVAGTLSMVNAAGGDAPAWLNNTNGAITPGARTVAMVQDLIFYGRTLLWVERNPAGDIIGGLRLPPDLWSVDSFGNITLGGRAAPQQNDFIYTSSYLPMGFLEYGEDTIKHYIDLRNTIRSRSRNPIPLVELKVTDQFEGTTKELEEARDNWQKARSSENGAVAFTPNGVDLTVHQPANSDAEMLTAARNGVRLDIANFLNLDAAVVDGNSGRSQDYGNTLQTASEFVKLSLPLWLNPIEQRLSQDDVTPPGTRVRYDVGQLDTTDAKGNLGTATGDISA